MKDSAMKVIDIVYLISMFALPVQAQQQSLTVGEAIPNVSLYPYLSEKDTVELYDYKGKWVILDFWSAYCGACMKSLKRVEKLQNEFDQDIQVILINNRDDPEEVIAHFKDKGWEIPANLLSTTQPLADAWFPHNGYPHQVWVNPQGVIKAITSELYATPEVMKGILSGGPAAMHLKQDISLELYEPILSLREGSVKPYFYSAVTPRLPDNNSSIINYRGHRLYHNLSALSLFKEAYEIPSFNTKNHIIVELSDSTRARLIAPHSGSTLDSINSYYQWQQDNIYCYSFYLPAKLSEKERLAIMQRDLNLFFDHHLGITAHIEKRSMSCLVLSQEDDRSAQRVDRKNNSSQKEITIAQLTQMLESNLRQSQWRVVSDLEEELTVSISLQGDLNDLDSVKHQLKQQGFRLIREVKALPVLVISDKQYQ
ncbi:TlpA family protein disulfide reductase [Fulvivirga maritima]|uniref:TlpA family protein disulfide reductase n=1 Tax=Fulvivirga maritima TaxID=2904247 RepID=UPI001F15A0B0|nr:TlpA disulfide reductase family protein [Fulvivirga maritima]UII27659.1 TlpA family protein disulfide reductase [Fulvivirga maritima]